MTPQRPSRLHPLASELLSRLKDHPEASEIVIGGGVALSHYLEHRATFDLDAWWKSEPKPETIGFVRAAMNEIARSHGATFEEKRRGDVFSLNIREASGKRVFSFQIAQRDQYLEQPITSLWYPVLLETFADNVAAKMIALVDRGAPRDFLDIYEIVNRDLISLDQCLDLYQQKRRDADIESSKQQVLDNLELIEVRRPLDSIADPEERSYAASVRTWYYAHFGETEDFKRGVRL
jgi:hypothetical protein